MMPECCKNMYSGWYCPRCGKPVSYIAHGGSEPVPIGQLSTKNVTVNQQLIQGDFIAAGGTKIGTNLGTAVSGNVSVGTLADSSAPEQPLPPPPPVEDAPQPPPPSQRVSLPPPQLPVIDNELPEPPPGLGETLPPQLPVIDNELPEPPPGLDETLPPPLPIIDNNLPKPPPGFGE